MVRLAGDWAAKEDAMPDTYLREAQLMVLKGQESCLTYLRSGGDFGFLVSGGLVGGLVGAGPPGDGGVGSFPDASHVGANQDAADDAANRAKESSLKTNARLAGGRCEYPGLPGMELCAAFLDKGFDKDGQPLAEVAEEEAKAAPMPVEEVQKLLEPNNPDDDVYVVYSFDGQEKVVKAEPADEKQGGEAGVSELAVETREPLDAVLEDGDDDLEGRTLRFAMIDKPTSASKLHLPAVGTQKGEKTPKCGARGNYSFVMAGDAMDPTTELCIRCFGHRSEGACGRLRSVKVKADDLERFLEDHVLGQNAYKQADGVVVARDKADEAALSIPKVGEMEEVRKEMQVVVYRHLSRGQGSMEDAMKYYVDNDNDSLWRLMDPVLKHMPDQGVEESMGHKQEAKVESGRASSSSHPTTGGNPSGKPLITCLMCKKKHTPLCPLPADFRDKQRERKKVKKAEKKKAAAAAEAKAAAERAKAKAAS
eukprot:s155_g20.t1